MDTPQNLKILIQTLETSQMMGVIDDGIFDHSHIFCDFSNHFNDIKTSFKTII